MRLALRAGQAGDAPQALPLIESGFRYEISTETCTTGERRFDTREAFCAGLLSDAGNNGCALMRRTNVWLERCDGEYVLTP